MQESFVAAGVSTTEVGVTPYLVGDTRVLRGDTISQSFQTNAARPHPVQKISFPDRNSRPRKSQPPRLGRGQSAAATLPSSMFFLIVFSFLSPCIQSKKENACDGEEIRWEGGGGGVIVKSLRMSCNSSTCKII